MALTSGTRLGPYEILTPLGGGSMGHVYRARDTRLERIVAIKVLAPSPGGEARRLDRLHREARAISRVSHPNICALFDVGREGDVTFLVMEYLEGKTLAEAIEDGALPLRQTLAVGVQIADALDAAHRRGVIHRDLKPSNVMLIGEHVKLLDFGLAKLYDADAEGAVAEPTRSMALTEEGAILGTYPYMSPEQVQGREVDARSDIFAVGTVLYEMATGRRPFAANSRAALAAAILAEDPAALSTLAPSAPPSLDRLVAKCLAKDPDARWQTARDLSSELRWIHEGGGGSSDAAAVRAQQRAPGTLRYVRIAAIAAFLATGLAIWAWLTWRPSVPGRTSAPLYRQATFRGDVTGAALSPDATMIAYVTVDGGGKQQLVVRDLSTGAELPIVRERAYIGCPAWSPDGSTLLFGEDAPPGEKGLVIRSIPRLGGTPRRLATGFCAAWSPDGRRLLTWYLFPSGFTLVDLQSQRATRVTLDDVRSNVAVDWHRDGRVLVAGADGAGKGAIWTTTPEGHNLVRMFQSEEPIRTARWAADGRAAYVVVQNSAGTADVMRVALDRTGRGRTAILLAGLQIDESSIVPSQTDFFDVSADGSRLLYARQLGRANLWRVDVSAPRQSTPRPLTSGSSRHLDPAISPDGTSIAYVLQTPEGLRLHRMTAAGAAPTLLVAENGAVAKPAWSPDGQSVAFSITRDRVAAIAVVPAAGGSSRTLALKAAPSARGAVTWTPDGRLAYQLEDEKNFHLHAPDSGAETPVLTDTSKGALYLVRFDSRGSQIAAFWNRPADGQGLWVFQPGGAPAKFLGSWLVPAGWLPDDRSVVAYEQAAPDLFVVDTATGQRRRLAHLEMGTVTNCDVSRDGTFVVCAVYERQADAWIVDHFDPEASSPARAR